MILCPQGTFLNYWKACKIIEHALEIAIPQSNLARWNSKSRLAKTMLSNSDSVNNSRAICGAGYARTKHSLMTDFERSSSSFRCSILSRRILVENVPDYYSG